MPIFSEKNLYPGVNAHLNSILQNEPGGWQSFHAEHIVDLARAINENLPTGYFARSEKTLQIIEEEILTPDDFLTGIVIYQAGEGSALGRPVATVELLSPANKPGGAHYPHYAAKRTETLRSGLRLVEIDHLHQQPPVTPQLPSYPDEAEGAYPYLALVSDPRPTFDEGGTQGYEIGGDDPLGWGRRSRA